jgi:proline iminopeptidase
VGAALLLLALAEGPAREEGTFVASGGVTLFFRTVGATGHPVVFLHGGPGLSMEDGGRSLEPLGRTHRLVLYDQRGGGRSELVRDPEKLTAAADVRDLEALREHFGLEKVALVGNSWGSGLAALYFEAHPERVSRIVFLDPMPPALSPYAAARGEATRKALGPAALARLKELAEEDKNAADDVLLRNCPEETKLFFAPYLHHPSGDEVARLHLCDVPAEALRQVPLVNAAVNRSLGPFDFRPLLGRIGIPVLVVEGEKTIVPLDGTREWARGGDARLLLIPDSGHATFLDAPDALVAALETFLDGGWPKGATEVPR